MTAVAASLRMDGSRRWRRVIFAGLIGGAVAIYLALVGIVPTFDQRPLITGVLSLGEGFVAAAMALSGYVAARRMVGSPIATIAAGAVAGLITGTSLSLLIVFARAVRLRGMFLHASDPLFNLLTLGGGADSFWVPALVGLVIGAVAGAVAILPPVIQRSIAAAVLSLVILGLFAGLLRTPLLASPFAAQARLLFATNGITLFGAAVTLAGSLGAGIGAALGARVGGRRGGMVGGVLGGVVGALAGGLLGNDMGTGLGISRPDAAALGALIGGAIGVAVGGFVGGYVARAVLRARVDEWYGGLPQTQRRVALLPVVVAGLLLVAALPHGFGQFFAQVVALVAIYILMGLGLNITLGLAGLLDLGFVAFFAVGGYTVALLTSTGPFGIADLPFWFAIPFAVLFAFIFGAFLGLPVLGIRGDYLAIATLGFGEIIRILSVSDLLRPILGGPQGVTNVPRPIPVPPGDPLSGPNQIYYIALVCAAIVAFVAFRLRDSRIGRAWVAIREDEDVAEALGINLVQTKLLAYALGAAFAGLGGAVFAGLVGAMFPTSIHLLVSINVAALIIVGGMGSIPGVVVGAIFLIGLPELFREFSEYRYLFYGAALILVMRFRPEGLLPSRITRRELHVEEENVEPEDAPLGSSVAELDHRREGAEG
jgi:branched-chain amino acid transport system permease protein